MYVVGQFYPWFKFYFPLFETHCHTLPYPKSLVVLSFRLIFNRIIKLGIRRSITLKSLWSE